MDGKDREGREGWEGKRRGMGGLAAGGILLQGLRGDRRPCSPRKTLYTTETARGSRFGIQTRYRGEETSHVMTRKVYP